MSGPAKPSRPTFLARWMRATLVGQFRQPHGWLGHLAGWVMTHRSSNVQRSAWTVELLDIQPGDRVLEVGCGPGLALAEASRRAHRGLTIGIDHSPLMVRTAIRRNRASVLAGPVQVRQTDVDDVSALGTTFDKVFCVNVAMFFPDRVEAFRTLRSVMAPGGVLAVTNQPRNAAASAGDAIRAAGLLREQLEAAGFNDIRQQVLDLEPAPAICLLAHAGSGTVDVESADPRASPP